MRARDHFHGPAIVLNLFIYFYSENISQLLRGAPINFAAAIDLGRDHAVQCPARILV